ncbi:MAG: T9SS type A sorting domain-containing protein [Christiangramia sp.]
MKLLLILFGLFAVLPSYSQLSIQSNDQAEHFLYVRDRELFVQKELRLAQTNTSSLQAALYLRKDAQLLQGEKKDNENIGNGNISVFQTGTSNAYQYNYWGMPVRILPNLQFLFNDFVAEPLDKITSRKVTLISQLDGKSIPLSISSKWLYKFSGKTYSSWEFLGNDFNLKSGEGFSMKGVNGNNFSEIEGQPINPGSAQIYNFLGMPNDGEIDLDIEKDQVILVGNPYPSALDLNKFLLENTATTGIAYFWDSSKSLNSHYLKDYEGGYGMYSPGANLYLPPAFIRFSDYSFTGETGKFVARRFAPIAQGFMVIGKNTGKIIFKNSQRVYQKPDALLSQFKAPSENIPSLILNIETDSTYIRQLGLAFRSDSSIEEDHAMDAEMFDEKPNEIAWSISGENYAINVRPLLDQELIPLNIYLKEAAELQFSISELRNFNPDRIFIYDSREGLYYSIKTGYYKMRLDAGEYLDRFYLSFLEKSPVEPEPLISPASEKLNKPKNVLLNSLEIFQNNLEEQLEIKMLYEANLQMLRLYTINGRLVSLKEFRGQEKEFQLATGNLSTGVYIVKVNTSDAKEITKKIEIRN